MVDAEIYYVLRQKGKKNDFGCFNAGYCTDLLMYDKLCIVFSAVQATQCRLVVCIALSPSESTFPFHLLRLKSLVVLC